MWRSVLLAACFVLVLIGGLVAYDTWFQQNCLKSHTEQYVYYSYHCYMYNSHGRCTDSTYTPEIGYTTVCDEWKK